MSLWEFDMLPLLYDVCCLEQILLILNCEVSPHARHPDVVPVPMHRVGVCHRSRGKLHHEHHEGNVADIIFKHSLCRCNLCPHFFGIVLLHLCLWSFAYLSSLALGSVGRIARPTFS
eukprot:3200526-Amphidinium_carterae.1